MSSVVRSPVKRSSRVPAEAGAERSARGTDVEVEVRVWVEAGGAATAAQKRSGGASSLFEPEPVALLGCARFAGCASRRRRVRG